MSSSTKFSRLCACLLNVSEARNKNVVQRIANAAVEHGRAGQSAVLNIFSDYDYNRSVLTIASPASHIANSVVSACKEAYNTIDISTHSGGHPRLGSVDLVPIHPLSGETTLEQCGLIAKEIAERLSQDVPGTSFFLFGYADKKHKGLVQRRKEVNWYSGKFAPDTQDIGASPSARYGLTGAGAIPYVMNCNVTINTPDVKIGRHIAGELRAANPTGLPGVHTLALPHDGNVEIACNVESILSVHLPWEPEECFDSGSVVYLDGKEPIELVQSFGDFYYVSPKTIRNFVAAHAKKYDVSTQNEVVVGFTPEEAHDLALKALSTEQYDFWKTRKYGMM